MLVFLWLSFRTENSPSKWRPKVLHWLRSIKQITREICANTILHLLNSYCKPQHMGPEIKEQSLFTLTTLDVRSNKLCQLCQNYLFYKGTNVDDNTNPVNISTFLLRTTIQKIYSHRPPSWLYQKTALEYLVC